MHFNTYKTYDTVVIGAGIAGCCVAFALEQKGQRVLLIDRSATPASGGSGAAGAFVSPKIGKGGPLQSLTNEAFEYAKDFYLKEFNDCFNQTGVLRIPKDEQDREKFSTYEQYNTSKYEKVCKEFFVKHGIKNETLGFWFEEAGTCEASAVCHALTQQIEFRQMNVNCVIREEEQESVWLLKGDKKGEVVKTINVVMATGYENNLFDMRYMGVKGTWGARGDYKSELPLKICMHKNMSISNNINGIIRLGATHVKAKCLDTVPDKNSLVSLENKVKEMIDSSDFVLKDTFSGMRAGSHDYFPLVGRVVNVALMSEKYPKIFMGAKPELEHFDGMYVLNGMGGRGFVFAPLMSKWLSELIVDNIRIDRRVKPDRLFLKWCRKLKRGHTSAK